MDISKFTNLVKAAMPNCDNKWIPILKKHTDRAGMTFERLCMFLVQVGHESNDLKSLSESLNYASTAIPKLFSSNRITKHQADAYGRTSSQPANQQELANIIYGGNWGEKNLGNTQVGDGWKYKGRGPIQLTGRANYTKCGKAIGVDLISSPELLAEDPDTSVASAVWFFETNTKGTDIKIVTKQINGGYNGLPDRERRLRNTFGALYGIDL